MDRQRQARTGTGQTHRVGKSTKRVGVKEISPGSLPFQFDFNELTANVASAKTKQIQTADKNAMYP